MSKKITNQILKFCVVGGIAFIIDYSVLFILTEFVDIPSLISVAISFIVSAIFNYILSIKWLFNVNQNQIVKNVVIFMILSTIGLGINELIICLGNITSIYYMISKMGLTAIVMVYNFIIRKIFIEKNRFRRKPIFLYF